MLPEEPTMIGTGGDDRLRGTKNKTHRGSCRRRSHHECEQKRQGVRRSPSHRTSSFALLRRLVVCVPRGVSQRRRRPRCVHWREVPRASAGWARPRCPAGFPVGGSAGRRAGGGFAGRRPGGMMPASRVKTSFLLAAEVVLEDSARRVSSPANPCFPGGNQRSDRARIGVR